MSPEIGQQGHTTRKFFYGWLIALCCTLITIVNGGIFFSFSVFFKPVALDFGWSRGEFAGSYTAMLVAYAPGAFFAGRLGDTRGPRVTLLLAALLIGLGFIGCSQARNLMFMTLSYATIGLGLGATFALPIATIQRWFVKWRGLMVGIVVAGAGIGGFLFAPFVGYLIASYNWQRAYLIMGIICGGLVAASASFLVSEPNMKQLSAFGVGEQGLSSDSRYQDGTSFTSIQAFRLSAFWGIAILFILISIPDFFIRSHLVPYVTDRGISAAVGAQGLGLIAGTSVVGRLAMSWLAGKIGWMKTLAIACFIASTSIIWLVFVTKPEAFHLFVAVFGFFCGSTAALICGVVGFFFGLAALSELLGFLLGIGVLVGAIAPLLGGLAFDLTGNYLVALAFSAFFLFIAGMLSLWLKPPRRS